MKVHTDCKHAVQESFGEICWTVCKLHDYTISPGQCDRCKDKKNRSMSDDLQKG